jgi:hypothetical protein
MTEEVEVPAKFSAKTIERIEDLFGKGTVLGYALLQDDRLADELKAQIEEPLSEEELVTAMRETSPERVGIAARNSGFGPENAFELYRDLVRRVNIRRIHRQVLEEIEAFRPAGNGAEM